MARQSNKLGLKISLPQNIQPEQTTQAPTKETVFETDKFGELKVTGISPTADGTRATINTDQGDFYFYTSEYVNKGNVSSGIQFYSKSFIDPTLRQQVNDNSVRVNLQDVPNSAFNSNRARDVLGAETGILVPKDVAMETVQRYTGMHRVSEEGRITGLSNGRYTLDNSGSKNVTFLYAEGDDPAANAQYFTPSEGGGMFKSVFGNNILGNALQGISDGLANVEDITREGIEGVDAALQNPYIRAAIKTVAAVAPNPVTRFAAAALDVYAPLDSGENPSAGQIANLVMAGNNVFGTTAPVGGDVGVGVEGGAAIDAGAGAGLDFSGATGLEIDADLALGDVFKSEIEKLVTAGASVIDGAEPLDVVLGVYGDDIAAGVTDAIGSVEGGEEIAKVLKDNPEIAATVLDVAGGTEVPEALANNFGDKVAGELGAETTNEIALVKGGLETAVSLDQGKDLGDAFFEGAKKSYEEGFRPDVSLPDAEGMGLTFSDLGIDLSGFSNFVGDINARFPTIPALALSLFEGGLSLPEIKGLGIDISGVEFPEVEFPEVEFTEVEFPEVEFPEVEFTEVEFPEVEIPEVAIDLPEVDINIPELDLPEVAVDLPEVEIPEVEGPDIDIQKPTLDLLDFSGLLGGLALGLSSSGRKSTAPASNIGGSAYQTQFDFLRNVEPLGTIGMFGRNKA
jgi:hypothetical protein